MQFSDALSEREIGKYPLSIATSLAIEGLTGINDNINEARIRQPLLQNIPTLWVNVATLIRNMVGSVHKNETLLLNPNDIVPLIFQEMMIIKDIADQQTNFRAQVVYFVSKYEGLGRRYPHASIRSPNTDKQKALHHLHEETLALVMKKQVHQDYHIHAYDCKIVAPLQPKSFILTHFPYDLLSANVFHELLLIESHTGKVKSRPAWHTKYYNGKTLVRIPFREDLLQIFGDSEFFSPLTSLKNHILQVAEQDNWTWSTTRDKIKYSIDKIKDPLALAQIKQIIV
jgi:hypothetical protein